MSSEAPKSSEYPKNVEINTEQKISDSDFLNELKIDKVKLDRYKLATLVEVIINFAELLSGKKFYPYQRIAVERIIWSIILGDGESITLEFARQSGKSESIGMLLPALCLILPFIAELLEEIGVTDSPFAKFKHGFWVGVYAPDYSRAAIIGRKVNSNLTNRNARAILSADRDLGMSFPKQLSSYLNHFPRGSFISVKSANKKVSIEGDTYHLVVTDETQEINDYVLKKSIYPFLSSTNGTMVHLGSAYPKRVFFYDVIKNNKQGDERKTKKRRNHFEFDYTVVQKYNPNYKKYIVKQKALLGEDSDEFRMSYCLYWALEKGMFVTEEYLVHQLGKDYYPINYDKTNDYVIGIDLGKNNDSTVVTVLGVDWENPVILDEELKVVTFNKKIANWLEIYGDDYEKQFYMIRDFISNYKWSTMVIDATGVGSPVYDRFNALYRGEKGKKVIPFVFNTPDKSYAYKLLSREFNSKRIIFPNSENAKKLRKQRRFIQQISNLDKDYRNGYLVVKHSEEKSQDDYGDSLMLAVYGVEECSNQMYKNHVNTSDIDIFGLGSNMGNNEFLNLRKKDKNFWEN